MMLKTPKLNTQRIKNSLGQIKRKTKSSPLYGRTLLMLFFLAFFIKIGVVYFSYKNLDGLKSCLSYICSDIIVLFIAQLLITVNSRIKVRYLRLLNDLIVFIMLLIYSVDIFTIFFFQSRVPIMEAMTIGSNGSSGFAGAVKLWISIFLFLGIISFFLLQASYRKRKNYGKRITLFFSMSSILYAAFYAIVLFFKIDVDYVENVLSLNLNQLVKNNEKNNITKDDGVLTYEDYMFNVQGEGKDLNIILVFAESLSAIDSANLGGQDKIPGFDKIQNEGIKFTNFITNGTTSDTAHISTLYGVIPLINMGANNTPYSGYKLLMQPLPEYLNTQGYRTTFVSAASLDFLDQRAFLSGAGFQKIIGEEAFTGKTYAFESAPDGDLYDRVLQEVQNQTGKYFIGLQTISFHRPYNTPDGKTESSALKYSDDELYKFYENLEEIGFFDNGILVILGDHRKMNPAEEGERELFGPNWYTRSVATVVGSGIQPGTINFNIIQHTDFYNSMKVLVGDGPVKIDKIYNNVFSEDYNRNWAITNAEFYEINRYTVSSTDSDSFLFRNLSNLKGKNDEVYNYFGAYLGFEFGNNRFIDNDIEDEGIKFIGHRGAIENAPENTLESFLAAKEQGAYGIEFDVSYTKDKQNIVVHGAEMYASNCTKLKVGDYTLDWITKNCTIKNGEKYRTLQEMLELVDGLFDYYFLEIKVYDEKLGTQQALDAIQTVKELNMQDRVIFISYSDAARNVLNSDPDIIYGWDTFDMNDIEFLGDNNSKYFLAPFDLLTPEIVEQARSTGKEIVTYTVNDIKDYKSVRDSGISLIMTDKIEMLKDYENNKYYPITYSLQEINLKKSSR